MKTISLCKGKETFVFKYEKGDEAAVLNALIDMVKNPLLNFDWFDAAHVSNQVGINMNFFQSKKKIGDENENNLS